MCRFLRPFGLSAPLPKPVRPGFGRFLASGPLQSLRLTGRTAPPASTPLKDFYIPPDQSVQLDLPPVGPPSESARFPIAPRNRFLLLVFRLRINVPGPLRFRRLAVPQTSWNLIHYALERFSRQLFWRTILSFSSAFISFIFIALWVLSVKVLWINRDGKIMFLPY